MKGKIVIPENINGILVTKIKDNGFKDCANITEVVMPKYCNSIGNYGFANCSNLKKITALNEDLGKALKEMLAGNKDITIGYIRN